MSSRLNHYETLGVSPTADEAEISRAFAKAGSVFRPHAFGGLAELCLAYETLRDPAKRRAYDAALGLSREPSPFNRSLGARETRPAQGAIMAASVSAPIRALQPDPGLWPQPLVARGTGPVDASAEPKPEPPLGPVAGISAKPEPRLNRDDRVSLPIEETLVNEVRPVDWKRAGVVLGSVVVGACLLGGLAGWWSASSVGEAVQAENSVSVPLPPVASASAPAAREIARPVVSNAPEVRLNRGPRPVAAATPIEPQPSVAQPATEAKGTDELQSDGVAVEQVADDATASSSVAAGMPLPDRVIARTIDRIGYSCGSVASALPVEGEAAGVFKVTCSSGQSYQARPVNGRYHFRRWGRR